MKKKILFLIALLVPFLVSAKEELSYGWDYENERGAIFLQEKDSEYWIGENFGKNKKGPVSPPKLSYFTPAGKKLRSVSYEDISEEVGREAIEKFKDRTYRGRYYLEIGEEFVELDPDSYELLICPNKEAYENDDDSCIWKDYDELTEAEVTKYIGDYKVMYDLMDRYPHNEFSFRRVGNIVLVNRYDYENEKQYAEVYDIDGKRIFSKKVSFPYETVSIDVNLYGIYVLVEEIDYEAKEATYELSKYDLSGKKEYTIDALELITENSSYEDLYYYLNTQIATVNGGLIINLAPNYFAEQMDACMDFYGDQIDPANPPKLDQPDPYTICKGYVLDGYLDGPPSGGNVQGDFIDPTAAPKTKALKITDKVPGFEADIAGDFFGPFLPTVVIKLNFDYEVATKVVEGKGTIKAISRSVGGEGVTFVVEPAKGYVLGVVKVTDALGNVIEFHDYTFTMPSSDVLIEVEFVKENPNTADIAILTVISLAIVFGIVLLNVNKKYRWLK
jgi:hypothetical protein